MVTMSKPYKMYMLVGLPGSGKSTYVNMLKVDPNYTALVASTDNYLELVAKSKRSTYDEVFKTYIDYAQNNMTETIKQAVEFKFNLIWDQTNLSIKTRKKKLIQFKAIKGSENYEKIAVFFDTDYRVCQERIKNRPGKTIPSGIMNNMIETLQIPTKTEGFDDVIVV